MRGRFSRVAGQDIYPINELDLSPDKAAYLIS